MIYKKHVYLRILKHIIETIDLKGVINMKKKLTAISILFLFLFMLGCTPNSYQSESSQYRNTAESDRVAKVEIFPSALEEYVELIDKQESQLILKYGEPSLKDALYGGRIYYYEDRSIAFGLDGDKISSLLLYKGQLNDGVKIGSSLDEIVQNLNLTEKDVQSSPESSQQILYDYKGHESYLIFYDGVLKEILIKSK